MRARRERFLRLLALRERELENKQLDAVRAKNALKETRIALEDTQNKLRQAALDFRVDPGQQRAAGDWITAGDWLKAKVAAVEKALHTHNLAKERVRLTTIGVQQAEREKRKVEKLLERIREEERVLEAVRDQKDTDEIAARATSAQRN